MTNISKHHGEKERKGDNCKQAWVDFLVSCDAIAVDDSLKSFRKFIGPVKRGWFLIRAYLLKNRRDTRSRLLLVDRR